MAEKDMLEDEPEVLDKKAQKKAERERKKEEKRKQKQMKEEAQAEEDDEEESGGGKLAVVVATVFFILIWLAILALVIKMDIGGFGSTVLQPILKDVPYINKILPETAEKEPAVDAQYPYTTLEEAIDRIKELEVELADAQSQSQGNSDTVAQLQAEVARLKEFENEQAAFEEEKTKFYEEVVFNENAPDISEYKAYYESIDPANAEVLYKQVVQQEETDKQIQDYVEAYSSMKPKQAAAIMEAMTDNLPLVAKILENMDADARGDILGEMDSAVAARVTKIMEP